MTPKWNKAFGTEVALKGEANPARLAAYQGEGALKLFN